ncbi:MAG: helix-turn-helix domain containing protein [Acidimicrobiales bacterium]|nr:helix-turn-helix domain containing protein [Acidimicrobiales bacterium]MDG1876549.1 helix-turn-helix domain containing protein [Acidimicrobiales bacterium]
MTCVDGRIARGERTRKAVVGALLSLYEENNLTPTIDDIASRVGMTSRTIYHHFADHEAIAEALREHQRPLIAPHLAAQPSGTLDARVQGLIAQRAELFELVAPVRRAALANMHRSARMRKSQAGMASRLRRQVATTFDTELSQLDDDLRAETLEILDLYLSWDTWERLRRWQRLSVTRSKALVRGLVSETLTPPV